MTVNKRERAVRIIFHANRHKLILPAKNRKHGTIRKKRQKHVKHERKGQKKLPEKGNQQADCKNKNQGFIVAGDFFMEILEPEKGMYGKNQKGVKYNREAQKKAEWSKLFCPGFFLREGNEHFEKTCRG